MFAHHATPHPHTHHRVRVRMSHAFNAGTPFGVLLIQGAHCQRQTQTLPKPDSLPAILVYGTPSGPAL